MLGSARKKDECTALVKTALQFSRCPIGEVTVIKLSAGIVRVADSVKEDDERIFCIVVMSYG